MGIRLGMERWRIEKRRPLVRDRRNKHVDKLDAGQVSRMDGIVQHTLRHRRCRQVVHGLTGLSWEQAPARQLIWLVRSQLGD
jgi:hypothetical protein